MSPDSSSRTAELYLRTLGPRGRQSGQETAVEHLEKLTAVGALEAYNVSVWGDGLVLETSTSQTSLGQQIHERVEDFRQWAAAAGLSLKSFFPTELVDSTVTDREYTCIQFPMMTLAEYEDDSLQFVSPCTDGDTVITVLDRLDALEATTAAQQSYITQPVSAADSTGRSADVDQIQSGRYNNG